VRRASSPGAPAICRAPGLAPAASREKDDRGSEVVELVLILPALMALVTALLQLAMWALAAHALSLAVAEGGAAARTGQGSPGDIVRSDVTKISGNLVGSLDVTVRALPDSFVSVYAVGTVPTILPGVSLHVSADSTGPVQEFRASG
jgi:hypothetical protein